MIKFSFISVYVSASYAPLKFARIILVRSTQKNNKKLECTTFIQVNHSLIVSVHTKVIITVMMIGTVPCMLAGDVGRWKGREVCFWLQDGVGLDGDHGSDHDDGHENDDELEMYGSDGPYF
ncbi:hypothetical protein B9Z55_004447 [Caenorhabditis nigoni]|uniref:Uncharacterized protein n=1 Tax=Caenorhabditis nigoni TaxID=1611254 RepID=A0A2G5UWE0_9PELO|nr:hypothetical protein B9Z55_004447 [Caenorhabditis nigoni]